MQVYAITAENIQTQVLSGSKPVLLDFYAPWCGPCNLLHPVLEDIAVQRPDIRVGKINTDTEQTLATRYKVFQIPTLLVIRNGVEEKRIVGARSKEELLALFA